MKPLKEIIGHIGIKAALMLPTKASRKAGIMELRLKGIISPSLAEWAIAVNGLRGA